MPRTEPALFVIFGATGDLTSRKLLPALYRLARRGGLGPRCIVLGVSRAADLGDGGFRALACKALETAKITLDAEGRRWCEEHLFYRSSGAGTAADFQALSKQIADLEQLLTLPANRVFYLALPPETVPHTMALLGQTGLNQSAGWTRVVVEKPFGQDLVSARNLNRLIERHFDESQVYRIDHYLGKETVQNLMVFRFANPIFETVWNRDRVESVELTVAEDLGIGHRAAFYERAGALRDIVQNHLTQLLCLVAMEVPATFEADAIRNEKIKVIRSIEPISRDDVVFGQYEQGQIGGVDVPGYHQEPGVASGSPVETFVAAKLSVANWRWQGVPFYLRTGKRLPQRVTAIVVTFRRAPVWVFQPFDTCEIHSNVLVITIQPDEGFDLHFDVKVPGPQLCADTQKLRFRYAEAFSALSDAYETLLLDVLWGDPTLFVRADWTEASWQLYTPILESPPEVHPYSAGTWGPAQADELLARDGRRWFSG